MRLQLALNVRDLEEAVSYYTKLFGVQPHKERPGYANFAIDRPPLKLVLFENPHADERLNHLGVEVFDPVEVEAALTRLQPQGLVEQVQRDETCCHATQDKVWSREPQGLRWEWYRITNDDPVPAMLSSANSCCEGMNNSEDTICCT
ncbi:glyoxalase/bleomycin resistance/extradiol dioxygenase family protein [Candidatus Entotheonella serta]|nr:glyoxalase/bleomycin resistance/extradiol dioxygenase family protein [Candidatus Entotheonella serta]